jgi:hypothetical protein
VARLETDDAVIFVDLLLGQLSVDRIGADASECGPWQKFESAGRIAVGFPGVFRLTKARPLCTSPVTSIFWGGSAAEIKKEDLRVMRLIGERLPRPRRWWQRALSEPEQWPHRQYKVTPSVPSSFLVLERTYPRLPRSL